jgi:nucleotide-binding universal stress UspA family protein
MPTSSPIPAPATAGRPSAPGGTIVHRPTIAVGVGSDRGWAALGWAVSEAAATGGRLVVCHVVPADSPLANRPGGVPLSLLELVAPALARAVAAARTRLGGNRVTLTVRAGRPGKALVSVAADARMLALGAPENSDWALRASTTHRVVTRAECPVIVVRSATGDARAPFAGHLVAGVDGSAPSRAALAFGFA